MPQPQDLTVGKGTVVMLFSMNKVGKTRFIGGGKRTLIIRPPEDHTDSIDAGADVKELVAETWSDLFEIFTWLQQGASEDYDWVWLDTISLMQDRLLEDVMDETLMKRPDRGVEKGGVTIPEFGPDKGEYKINMDRLSKWVRDMVGISKAGAFNFGITAHIFEWYDPVAEKDIWVPWIRGKDMIGKVCGYMNIIAYLKKQDDGEGGEQRVLLTDAPGFMGGDQLDCIPELASGRHGIVEPTMADLEKAIKKSPKRKGGGATAAPKKRPGKKRVVRRKK
jgi:hypothetical protein